MHNRKKVVSDLCPALTPYFTEGAEDVKAVAGQVLLHRMVLSSEASLPGGGRYGI